MQFAWLEKLASENKIRPHVRDEIYAECNQVLEKMGADAGDLKELGSVLGRLGAGVASGVGIMLGGVALMDHLKSKSAVPAIEKSKEQLLKNPALVGDKEKALARFKEIETIAPFVAAQPALASKIVENNLHSGLSDQTVQNIARIQASYHQDFKMPEKTQQRLDKFRKKQSARSQAKTAADVMSILKASGAVFPGEDLEKTAASTWDVGKNVLKGMAVLTGAQALLGVGAGAVSFAQGKFNEAKMKKKLNSSFQAALNQSDPAKEPLMANKDKARIAFETMAHFAPQAAADPSAARAFMNSMVSLDVGVSTGTVKELTEIAKNLSTANTRSPGFQKGFLAGFGDAGGGKRLGDVLAPVGRQVEEDVGILIEPATPQRLAGLHGPEGMLG